MMKPSNALRAALLLALTLLAAPAYAQASFQGLGVLPGDHWSRARDVSDDGAVVGRSAQFGGGAEAFRWIEGGGMQGLGFLPGSTGSDAHGVSADGAVVGESYVSSLSGEAFRWTAGGGLQGLGVLADDARSIAMAVSADGAVVVGLSEDANHDYEAFRWTASEGMQGLGFLDGDARSVARAVSADGAVVVGGSDNAFELEAFRWTEGGGMEGLGTLPGASSSSAYGVSADGAVVVGLSDGRAFRWTAGGGMEGLGTLPGTNLSRANDVSADGAVVVGESFNAGGGERAFIWTEADGMRPLKAVLEDDHGLDLSGWELTHANGVSPDGTVVVGEGQSPSGQPEAWRAVLPALTLLGPPADTLLVAGEDHTVRWRRPEAVAAVDVYLLPDTLGAPEILLDFGLDTDSLVWAVPDTLFSRSARLVVQAFLDPAVADTSDAFRVKPYHLTRLSADSTRYEPFDVARHGWSFANVEDELFPQTWWTQEQFDYPDGTDPFSDDEYDDDFPLPPISAAPSVFADWPAYVRAFGTDAAYHLIIPGIEAFYRASFVSAWAAYHGGDGWGGSCSGMAVASLLAFGHRDAFGAAYPAVGPVEELNTVDMSAGVREAVNTLFSYWPGKLQREHAVAAASEDPRDVLAHLKARLLDDDRAGDGYLYVRDVGGSGAHAVVPYRLARDPADDGVWRLFVYDPNEPEDDLAFVRIDSTANAWSYAGFDPAWGGEEGMFVMDPVTNYLGEAMFDPAAPAVDRHRIPAGGARGGAPLYVAATPGAAVALAGASGAAIGYADGVAFNEIEEARLDLPPVGGETPPVGYLVPPDAYTLTLGAFPGALASASFFDGGRVYSYGRADADGAHTDRLAYDAAEGLTARSEDAGAAKHVTLRAVVAGEEHERVLDAQDLALTGVDAVRFAVEDHAEGHRLRLANDGGDKTYTLRLRQSDAGAQPAFVHHGVPLAEGAIHLARPDWATLGEGPVEVDVDTDGDGEPDSTLVLENQLPPPSGLVVTLTPEAAPVVIPPEGGAFRFTFAVTNTTEEPAVFDAWTAAEGPVDRSPALGPRAVTLAPGATASRALRQRVPAAAPPGAYTYGGFVGTFPGAVLASDAFTVTKEAPAGRAAGRAGAAAGWPAAEWGDEGWTVTGGEPAAALTTEAPSESVLHAARPNPSAGRVTLPYDVAEAGRVRVAAYDLLGREVAVLDDGERAPGRYEAALDGRALAAGTYLVRMTAPGGFSQTRRVTLLR